MGYKLRMLMVLVTILISLSYSLVNLAILITYQIRSPSYWSFWIFNTSTFVFGFCSVILIKAVPVMRTWIVNEFFMNLTMFFISLANIFCFLLSFIHFIFNFAGYGFWLQDGPHGGTGLVFMLTFATFLVNLPPFIAILYETHKAHLHHRAKAVQSKMVKSSVKEANVHV